MTPDRATARELIDDWTGKKGTHTFSTIRTYRGLLRIPGDFDRPLKASEIGRIAGLGVFNTVATKGKRWAIIYGAWDCLAAEGKAKKEKDGPCFYVVS